MGFLFLFNLLTIPMFLTEMGRLVSRLPIGERRRTADPLPSGPTS